MSTVRTASVGEIRPVIEAFGRLEWPASPDQARTFVDELGWTVLGERRGSMRACTDLRVRNRRARLSFLDEADGRRLGDIMLRVSDPAVEGTTTGGIDAACDTIVAAVEQVLGDPANSAADTTTWDLPSGARVEVQRTETEVVLLLVGARLANIGREEDGLGIGPLTE